MYTTTIRSKLYTNVESQLVKGGAPISLDRGRPKVFVTGLQRLLSYETSQESYRLSYYLNLSSLFSPRSSLQYPFTVIQTHARYTTTYVAPLNIRVHRPPLFRSSFIVSDCLDHPPIDRAVADSSDHTRHSHSFLRTLSFTVRIQRIASTVVHNTYD